MSNDASSTGQPLGGRILDAITPSGVGGWMPEPEWRRWRVMHLLLSLFGTAVFLPAAVVVGNRYLMSEPLAANSADAVAMLWVPLAIAEVAAVWFFTAMYHSIRPVPLSEVPQPV